MCFPKKVKYVVIFQNTKIMQYASSHCYFGLFFNFSDSKHESKESDIRTIQKLPQLSEKHFIGLSLFQVSMMDCKWYFSKEYAYKI